MRLRLYATVTAAALLGACGGDGAPADRAESAGEAPAPTVARVDTTAPPPLVDLPASAGLPDVERAPTAPEVTDGAPPVDATPVQAVPTPPAAPASPTGPATDVGGADPSDAEEILARAEEAYSQIRSMEADFVQRVAVPLLDTTVNGRGKLYHRAPDRFLMRFTDPEGDIVLTDGTYGWLYYPSTDSVQVMRSRLSDRGQQVDLQREFLSDATRRFTATLDGGEPVGGRRTHVLTLIPRQPTSYRRVRIWVDAENFLVRRFEITEENDSVRTIELSNIRPNVALDDDLFRFTPPPGTQVVDF